MTLRFGYLRVHFATLTNGNGALVAWYGSAVQSVQRSRREIEEVIDRDVLPGIPVNERAQQRSLLIHCVT